MDEFDENNKTQYEWVLTIVLFSSLILSLHIYFLFVKLNFMLKYFKQYML